MYPCSPGLPRDVPSGTTGAEVREAGVKGRKSDEALGKRRQTQHQPSYLTLSDPPPAQLALGVHLPLCQDPGRVLAAAGVTTHQQGPRSEGGGTLHSLSSGPLLWELPSTCALGPPIHSQALQVVWPIPRIIDESVASLTRRVVGSGA